nr:HAMP domain-containing sensor histidine kinase [Lachnoclostridium phytofermentans]
MINSNKKCGRFRLALLFAFIIFIIMLVTVTLLFGIFIVLSHYKMFESMSARAPLTPIFLFAVVSVIIGTIISIIFSRIPLSPIREIISAADRLAEGDFSVRVKLKGPQEFQKLNTSFNHMAEELESIEILRSDFINNFSHEFKTPIVSMRGFAKMLKYNDLTKEETDEYLDIIISESDRLAELATNVLNLSKIENQTIVTDKTRFNVSEQIRRVVVLLEKRWMEKNLEIAFDCEEIFLYGNEELLKQVWINLIDNAIKFSALNSIIDIQIIQNQEYVVITISDQGTGMSDDTKNRIFDKFYQGDTSHATKGNGLGLTIAKKIVELHDGKIQIIKSDQSGTSFEVNLHSD